MCSTPVVLTPDQPTEDNTPRSLLMSMLAHINTLSSPVTALAATQQPHIPPEPPTQHQDTTPGMVMPSQWILIMVVATASTRPPHRRTTLPSHRQPTGMTTRLQTQHQPSPRPLQPTLLFPTLLFKTPVRLHPLPSVHRLKQDIVHRPRRHATATAVIASIGTPDTAAVKLTFSRR